MKISCDKHSNSDASIVTGKVDHFSLVISDLLIREVRLIGRDGWGVEEEDGKPPGLN